MKNAKTTRDTKREKVNKKLQALKPTLEQQLRVFFLVQGEYNVNTMK